MQVNLDSASHVRMLFERMAGCAGDPALFRDGAEISFDGLLSRVAAWECDLLERGIGAGTVCAFTGDYAPDTIALMLALMRLGGISLPLTLAAEREQGELLAISGAEWLIRFNENLDRAGASVEPLGATAQNGLIEHFRATGHPGLIVFTSGSSGRPKGILHDFDRVLGKFAVRRPGWRTILFLSIDHFGGINTLMACLAYGGVGICVSQRTPDIVCGAVASARATLLPTTPTFLNMLRASGTWRLHDLSSLRLITYGAEPMPEATLKWIGAALPNVELKQTYGLSELGVLHSRSPERQSLWLRLGGQGFQTRIVDNVLHIRSESNMVGYLNAPSPIDEDGWMNTGDMVEMRDGMVRFLGRTSEVLNVGGQKVFPAEVENVLLGAEGVVEATVFGRRHPLLGQAVCARVSLSRGEDAEAAAQRLRLYCLERLAKFKVPMRIEVVQHSVQTNERSKKVRRLGEGPSAE
ncbi:MAG TPA: fatty acid--CoA ligase family protein [Alphaproteobacteria bacterium]|nr:fatty acid--CoA ligase family protein [Alphaproteobacteria bacterium]